MILVVEDDEDVRELVEFSLTSRGFTVRVVPNGAAALDAITQARPCLVILDLHMPVMTGWELLAELGRRGLGDVPVCVTSALSGRAPAQAVATLSKPFNTRELVALSSRYCAHHVVR